MNSDLHHLRRGCVALLLGALSLSAFAHGDEPHGDAPHGPEAPALHVPRIEAATDDFELVARLKDEALTLFINRFETGEPVLEARVELEAGELQAQAVYEAGQGSYVVRDAAFIQSISRPGTHALVMTVVAGEDADLLEGSLAVADPAATAAGGRSGAGSPAVLALSGALAAGALGAGAFYLRRRTGAAGGAR